MFREFMHGFIFGAGCMWVAVRFFGVRQYSWRRNKKEN